MDNTIFTAALTGLLHDVDSFAERAGQAFPAAEAARLLPARWRSQAAQDERAGWAATLAALLAAGSSPSRPRAADALPPSFNQLRSIFCGLEADGRRMLLSGALYWPLQELGMVEERIFPAAPLSESESARRMQSLWQRFAEQANLLAEAFVNPATDPGLYLEGLLLLLQRFAWCVPAPRNGEWGGASLFDHARVCSALACVLADGNISNQDLRALAQPSPEERALSGVSDRVRGSERPAALLVGGDLSGVQSFLYTITARGAAGALRGRSFYLQLLTEAAARYTLARLGLPATNLLYQGGGNLGECMAFGRISGRNAAAEKPWS